MISNKEKRERIAIKRAVFRHIRLSQGKLNLLDLVRTIGKSGNLISWVVWGMIDRGELLLTPDRKLDILKK